MLVLLGPLYSLTYGLSALSRGDVMIVFAFLITSGLQLIGMAAIIEEMRKP
jgi:hypothetical protein